MKKTVLIILSLLLCNFIGCDQRTNNNGEPSTVLFVEDNKSSAYILCGFEKGEYKDLSNYKYNGRDWDDFIGQNETEVKTDLIKPGQEFNFYDAKGNENSSKIQKVTCIGRGIDDFTEVHANVSSKNSSVCQIGLTQSVDPYPRVPSYGQKTIEVDLDENGIADKIQWSFSKSSDKAYGDMQDYFLIVKLNNQEYTLSNPKEMPLKEEDFTVFVMDLNNDGNFEVIVYVKLANMVSSITVYSTENDDFQKLFDYVINPGP